MQFDTLKVMSKTELIGTLWHVKRNVQNIISIGLCLRFLEKKLLNKFARTWMVGKKSTLNTYVLMQGNTKVDGAEFSRDTCQYQHVSTEENQTKTFEKNQGLTNKTNLSAEQFNQYTCMLISKYICPRRLHLDVQEKVVLAYKI